MNEKPDNTGGISKNNATETKGKEQTGAGSELNRRAFFGAGSLGAAALATLGRAADNPTDNVQQADAIAAVASDVEEATIADLQAAMSAGRLTAVGLVRKYLARINQLDKRGPQVNSVLELNPDALAIARVLDTERRLSGVRGPLHGIPVLLKGNIDTADKMQTTAGSLALLGPAPSQDATVAARLRAAGAIILGKANLSEWANFRSSRSTSGWSGVGGQTNNPYFLDRNHSLSREQGIDAVLQQYNLDALVAPTGAPAWPTDLINSDHFLGASSFYAAMAGYPIVNVPAGFAFGLPVGLSFIGTAFSEPVLIRLAYAFEQATKVRQAPKFVPILKLGVPITSATAVGSDTTAQATPFAQPVDADLPNNGANSQTAPSVRPHLL